MFPASSAFPYVPGLVGVVGVPGVVDAVGVPGVPVLRLNHWSEFTDDFTQTIRNLTKGTVFDGIYQFSEYVPAALDDFG